jgi:hypothetical protein
MSDDPDKLESVRKQRDALRARLAETERELEGIREIAANPLALQKVRDALGPLSLWSKSGLEAHIKAELAAYKLDAERYRWLLKIAPDTLAAIAWRSKAALEYSDPQEAIDAAMGDA